MTPKAQLFILASVSSLAVYFMLSKYLTYNHVKYVLDLKHWRTDVDERLSALTTRFKISQHEARPPSQYGHRRNFLPPERDLEDKYIIYRCNSTRLCGGLADRQEGIVTSYLISQMLRRKFGVILKKGCDFSNYVIPNDVNWLIDENTLKEKSVDVKRLIDNRMMGYTMRETRLEELFYKDVTYYEGNMDYIKFLMQNSLYKSLDWARNQSHSNVFRIALAHLFKFADNTRQRYEEFLTNTNPTALVCAHFRMGKSKTLPQDDSLTSRRPNLESVLQFLKRILTHSLKLFIATDSDEVRGRLKYEFPDKFIEVEGPIVHIDRFKRQYNCSGLEKAILDQYILSTCDTLIMSISGFSRVAAYVRGRDDKLYLADPRNITKTTLSRIS